MTTTTDQRSRFIIAAPNSNAGKTTITLGLLRLFKNKGISVQPFKAGPDFIDPKFHQQACGKIGINLDLFMMSDEHIREQLDHFGDHQVSTIEGVMGLFDGARKAERSTAELAIKMNIPVILVVDARSVAYSVAPLIQGFKNFDPNLDLKGVIFNRVGSEGHYSFLKDACEDVGVKSFGYVRQLENIQIPSRHLGLDITQLEQYDGAIEAIAMEMENTLDWQLLLEETTCPAVLNKFDANIQSDRKFQFAVAKDEAFNFIYPQHIHVMESVGSVTFFSPIRDEKLPDADIVYFPGGYPECYLSELSANKSMLESIRTFVDNGGKALAECGGMMYLGKGIVDRDGNNFPMVGVFDFTTSMEQAKMTLGYRKILMDDMHLKGHEFHYSTLVEQHEAPAHATVLTARGTEINTNIFVKNKVMASYIHFYFGEKELLLNIIKKLEEL